MGCNVFTFWHDFDRVLNLKVNRYRNIWNSQLFLQIKWCSPHVPQHLFPIIRCAHRFVNYTPFHCITLVVSNFPRTKWYLCTSPPMTNVWLRFLSRCCSNQWGCMAPKFDSCLCSNYFFRSCVFVLETTFYVFYFDVKWSKIDAVLSWKLWKRILVYFVKLFHWA